MASAAEVTEPPRARAGRARWAWGALPLRAQLLVLMVVPVFIATSILGWLAYQTARETITRDAIRAVGLAANAREAVLVMRLERQRDRMHGFLKVVASECPRAGAAQAACMRRILAEFVATEEALAAAITGEGAESVLVGEGAEALAELPPTPPRQIARFEPKQGTSRAYDIVVQEGSWTLSVRFSGEELNRIFQDRYGLGTSGETFLADSHGVFITEPKYPGHSGESHSHPIDARPMRECLSGKDAEILAPDYRNVPVVHGFRFIEEIGGGCIMAHIEQAEAFAPVRALRTRVAGVIAGLAVLAVGVSVVFSRRLSRPVARLTARARALQAGDFESTVPREGTRELQTFAETFTAMAQSLKASTEERERLLRKVELERAHLRMLAGLSHALAESRLDFRAILEVTCRQLAEHLGDVCVLRSISVDGKWLDTLAAHSPDTLLQASLRPLLRERSQRVSEGVSARVIATGEPVLLPEVPPEMLEGLKMGLPPDHQEFLERFVLRSLVVVPLRSRERILGTLSLLRSRPGQPYSEEEVALLQDAAHRAALAVENARLFQQAQEAIRIREDIVAIVSHDLRNPLHAVSMSAAMLLERGPLEDRQAKGLARIASAADRANRMIRDLLDFTQGRQGGIPIQPAPCDLHALARHVVEEVQAVHPERSIGFEALGEGRGAWDCDRMAQVVANLVGNAVQHSPPDTPVRVTVHGEDGIVLEVHNGGTPIAPEELRTIFEPFRRGHSVARGPGGSVGLGLFISRQIVEAHGGRIEVTSTAAEGTTFTVRLPRAPK